MHLYRSKMAKLPLLTAAENIKLCCLWQDNKDIKARDKVVDHNLRLVYKIVSKHIGRFDSKFPDCFQEGVISLTKAIDNFDRNISEAVWSTYIGTTIRSGLLRFIINNHSIVRIGKHSNDRKLFWKIGKEKSKLESFGQDASPEALAKIFDITPEEIVAFQQRAESNLWQELDGVNATKYYYDESKRNESRHTLGNIVECIDKLKPIYQEVFWRRCVLEETLDEIGSSLNLTKERIRQIEVYIKEKIKKRIK